MLITKRGEKLHAYVKFKCDTCGTEFICDAKDRTECVISKFQYFVDCPVCGCTLSTSNVIEPYIPTEEYNKIKSQYEQME